MKDITKFLIKKLYIKTGILAKSARLNYGSMKEYVTFTIPYRKDIREFCKKENYYIKGVDEIYGLRIDFLGFLSDDRYHKKHGYEFEVKMSRLE